MKKIYSNVEELIGHTPLMEINNIENELSLYAHVLVKLEYLNPAGSAKDRVAKNMLDDALEKGLIDKDTVIIEPTSGNTGIGLAALGAARGYKTIIVMPDTMSKERIKTMEAYGAQVVLSDGVKGMAGCIEKANELSAANPNSFIPGQFENPANSQSHYLTTGPEIYEDTEGAIDMFVAGIGTGGTITGTAQYLKEKNPDIKIIGIEPEASPFLTKGVSGPHPLQGIGAGFKPSILNTDLIDEIVTVSGDEAYAGARLLGKKEGILVGITSGAALHVGLELAKKPENKGKNIVVLLPDTGLRYLSSDLF